MSNVSTDSTDGPCGGAVAARSLRPLHTREFGYNLAPHCFVPAQHKLVRRAHASCSCARARTCTASVQSCGVLVEPTWRGKWVADATKWMALEQFGAGHNSRLSFYSDLVRFICSLFQEYYYPGLYISNICTKRRTKVFRF